MNKLLTTFLMVILLLSTSSCSKPSNTLDNTHWVLKHSADDMPVFDDKITLEFTDNHLSGLLGEDTFASDFELTSKEAIHFKKMINRFNSDDPKELKRRVKFINSLRDAAFFKKDEKELIFYDQYGVELFYFSSMD